MPKRSTIGRDPFADSSPLSSPNSPFPPETNVVALATVAAAKENSFAVANPARAEEPAVEAAPVETVHIEDAAARRAVGGRLEIFGGDLGAGASVIWRHGTGERIGFFAPTGRLIDLAQELEAAQAWQDRTEHRVLSTLGWAWVVGSLGGILGIVAGGGLRLLLPKRMILQMRLTDGSKLVARTDSVTISGIKALAHGRSFATA